MNEFPAFRDWQMAHALKHGHVERYHRLKIRWAIRTIIPAMETTSGLFARYAEQFKKIASAFKKIAGEEL